MEAINTGGLVVTVIGVSTVFTALTSLGVLITFLARLSDDAPTTSPSIAPPTPAASTAETIPESAGVTEPDVDLERIALAAYALHRRHRIDRGAAGQPTSWVHAGRVRATGTFDR